MRTAGVSANILFSRTDIPDGELVPVHGETDFKTGKGEAVDSPRVLLVVGPGVLSQNAPQSLLPTSFSTLLCLPTTAEKLPSTGSQQI